MHFGLFGGIFYLENGLLRDIRQPQYISIYSSTLHILHQFKILSTLFLTLTKFLNCIVYICITLLLKLLMEKNKVCLILEKNKGKDKEKNYEN